MIRRNAQLTAMQQRAGKLIERARLDEASLVMTELRPGIGEEHIDAGKAGIGDPLQHAPRIVHVGADIGQSRGTHLREQLGHTILEGLAANETGRGMQLGLRCKMLSPAEPDLKCKVSGSRKQSLKIKRSLRKALIRGKTGNKRPLMKTQRPPLSSAMERAALPSGICQANMLLSWETRSVRSQENPPSASAARPK